MDVKAMHRIRSTDEVILESAGVKTALVYMLYSIILKRLKVQKGNMLHKIINFGRLNKSITFKLYNPFR